MKITSLRYIAFFMLLTVVACKKEMPNRGRDPEPDPVVVVPSYEEQVKDSVFYYTKLLSLWQVYMPPRNVNDIEKEGVIKSYTKAYSKGEDVLNWLLSLTPNDPETGNPIDRFSFMDREGVVSGEIENAVATSFGMQVFYLGSIKEDNAYLYVKMVDVNSPAYNLGIRRGDRIVSINNNKAIDYNAQNAENFKTVNDALNAQSMSISFVNPTGALKENQDLQSRQYNFDPILANQVLSAGNKKIGYLAFSSFVSIYDNAGDNSMSAKFDQIFAEFESQQITELVVDMRYNGGGAVLTAEYLANRIVPTAANQKLMYTYEINETLKSWGWLDEGDEFAPVKYAKIGNLNLPRVYFLVSDETASASELLINSLKPYMNVVMIGTKAYNEQNQLVNQKTYGKPVGFFGVDIVDSRIELYVSSFKTFNSNKEGDYFAGLVPQHHVEEFTHFVDFGQQDEPMLAAALNLIAGKALTAKTMNAATRSISAQAAAGHSRIAPGLKSKRTVEGMYKFKK